MKKPILFAALLLVFAACGDDDTGPPPTPNPCGSATVNKNGVGVSVTTIMAHIANNWYGTNGDVPGRRLDITLRTTDGTLTLTVGRPNNQHPDPNTVPVKTYVHPTQPGANCNTIAGEPTCDSMLGTFVPTEGGAVYMTLQPQSPGRITITGIDGTAKKVSGNYSFMVQKVSGGTPADTLRLSGSFTNVCYTLQ